jgi:hypothetical protein
MGKILVGCLSILMMSTSLLGQEHTKAMIRLIQPDSPAIFIRTTYHVKELLKSATLKNVSNTSLTGYRIGLIAVYPGGKDKVGLGLQVDVPKGIDPGQIIEVPAQAASPSFSVENASALVFFITDVHTATGTVWNPELEQIEKEARHLAELATVSSN